MWKTLYLLPWAIGGHLHGDTREFNIKLVSLMCHMDSLVEETLCILFYVGRNMALYYLTLLRTSSDPI